MLGGAVEIREVFSFTFTRVKQWSNDDVCWRSNFALTMQAFLYKYGSVKSMMKSPETRAYIVGNRFKG